MSSCTDALNKNKELVNSLKISYELDLQDALSGFIGVPLKGSKYYDLHQKLWDKLYTYVMETGEISDYEVEPFEQINDWQRYFRRLHGEIIDNRTIRPDQQAGTPRRLRALVNGVTRISKVRNKFLKKSREKGGMKLWKRALYPPGTIAMHADRFGILSKLVEVTTSLSDKVRQSYIGYTETLKSSKMSYKKNFDSLIGTDDNPGLIDHNNVMDGIPGVYDKDGNSVRIIGRKVQSDGRVLYEVSYDDKIDAVSERNLTKFIHESGLQYKPGLFDRFIGSIARIYGSEGRYPAFTFEKYKELLLDKYVNRLVNDIMHGQKRYFIPKIYSDASARDKAILDYHLQPPTVKDGVTVAGTGGRRWHRTLKSIQLGKKDAGISSPEIQYTADRLNEYIIIKSSDPFKDSYHVYLIGTRKDDTTKKWDNKLKKNDPLVYDLFPEGFYQSDEQHTYNFKQGLSSFSEINGIWSPDNPKAHHNVYPTTNKEWSNFYRMPQQPDVNAIDTRIESGGIGETYNIFWDVINSQRATLDEAGTDIGIFAKKNDQESKRLLPQFHKVVMTKINSETGKKYTAEEARDFIDDYILSITGIETVQYWEPDDKGLSTPDSYFRKKMFNYAPVMWHDEQIESQLDDRYNALNRAMKFPGQSAEAIKTLKEQRDNIHEVRMLIANRGHGWDRKTKQATSTVHLEHREVWTKDELRRKDGDVLNDYFHKTYTNLHRNDMMNQLINSTIQIMSVEKHLPADILEWMANRVKVSMGHSDTISRIPTFRGWTETKNSDIAAWLNKWTPKALKVDREWDDKSAERIWLGINGTMAMRWLGSWGALGNKTQIINPIVKYGFDIWWDAHKIMNNPSEKEYWRKVVESSGVMNLLSMFHDVMLQGGEVDTFDAGFYPFSQTAMKFLTGATAPLPTRNYFQWLKLLKTGRSNYVKKGSFAVDKLLVKLLMREKGSAQKQDIDYLRKLGKIAEDMENGTYDFNKVDDQIKDDIRGKRGDHHDLMALEEKDNTEEIIYARMSRLIGDVADTKLRKMVTWKLSWHFLKERNLFTFTEGEQDLRFETAIMAVLHAERWGLLGGGTSRVDKRYTESSKKVQRDAVYQMMFGMSPVWLGEGFSGIGRSFLQFKPYELFQMIHDHNILRSFTDGSVDKLDNMGRLGLAMSPNNKDREAQAVLRLILMRVLATGVGVGAAIVPFAFKFMMRTGGVTKMIRNAENPVFSKVARMLAWTVLMSMGWDSGDEDEKRRVEKLREDWMGRLFLTVAPVLIGALARDVYDWRNRINGED